VVEAAASEVSAAAVSAAAAQVAAGRELIIDWVIY
jgi:hypothetical protein